MDNCVWHKIGICSCAEKRKCANFQDTETETGKEILKDYEK